MSIPLNTKTISILLKGKAGTLECAYDSPDTSQGVTAGTAIIAHPNPQQGGSMDNKVVHTMARALLQLGYEVWRFNYRGVGLSEGQWDNGHGEVDDMLTVIQHVQNQSKTENKPLLLAGFSFGAFIAAKVNQQLTQTGSPIGQLILVGLATGMYEVPPVPTNTLIIHGEEDEVIPCQAVLDWCRPQHLPITVMPGASHFFHGYLPTLKNIILQFRLNSIQ